MTKVFLIGENLLMMEALQLILEKEGYHVKCGSYQDSISEPEARDFDPDITCWGNDIIDSGMEDLINCREQTVIGGKYIMILGSTNLNKMGQGMNLKIEGYIHKKGGVKDLIQCLEALKSGKKYLSVHFAGASNGEADTGLKKHSDLTPREQRIMELVYSDNTNEEIAEIMHISDKTVKNHRYSICKKLGLSGPNALKKFTMLYYNIHKPLGGN